MYCFNVSSSKELWCSLKVRAVTAVKLVDERSWDEKQWKFPSRTHGASALLMTYDPGPVLAYAWDSTRFF